MKYVHAITDGRQGVEGDLEKSKRQIKRYKETVSVCGSGRLFYFILHGSMGWDKGITQPTRVCSGEALQRHARFWKF